MSPWSKKEIWDAAVAFFVKQQIEHGQGKRNNNYNPYVRGNCGQLKKKFKTKCVELDFEAEEKKKGPTKAENKR